MNPFFILFFALNIVAFFWLLRMSYFFRVNKGKFKKEYPHFDAYTNLTVGYNVTFALINVVDVILN